MTPEELNRIEARWVHGTKAANPPGEIREREEAIERLCSAIRAAWRERDEAMAIIHRTAQAIGCTDELSLADDAAQVKIDRAEALAAAAALRAALEVFVSSYPSYLGEMDRDGERESISTAHSLAKEALSSDAGKPLLEKRIRAEERCAAFKELAAWDVKGQAETLGLNLWNTEMGIRRRDEPDQLGAAASAVHDVIVPAMAAFLRKQIRVETWKKAAEILYRRSIQSHNYRELESLQAEFERRAAAEEKGE